MRCCTPYADDPVPPMRDTVLPNRPQLSKAVRGRQYSAANGIQVCRQLQGLEFPEDGRFHRLEIKTNRPETTVRARSGHFGRVAPRSETGTRRTLDPAGLAIADAVPRRDLAMQAMAAPFATSRGDAAVAVVVGLRHQIAYGTGLQVVDLVPGAFEQDGRQRTVQRQTARLRLGDNRSAETNYELLTLVNLKPGRYRLRIGAHIRCD
jgi:hypothetical protein